jgi:hypothetical protein
MPGNNTLSDDEILGLDGQESLASYFVNPETDTCNASGEYPNQDHSISKILVTVINGIIVVVCSVVIFRRTDIMSGFGVMTTPKISIIKF